MLGTISTGSWQSRSFANSHDDYDACPDTGYRYRPIARPKFTIQELPGNKDGYLSSVGNSPDRADNVAPNTRLELIKYTSHVPQFLAELGVYTSKSRGPPEALVQGFSKYTANIFTAAKEIEEKNIASPNWDVAVVCSAGNSHSAETAKCNLTEAATLPLLYGKVVQDWVTKEYFGAGTNSLSNRLAGEMLVIWGLAQGVQKVSEQFQQRLTGTYKQATAFDINRCRFTGDTSTEKVRNKLDKLDHDKWTFLAICNEYVTGLKSQFDESQPKVFQPELPVKQYDKVKVTASNFRGTHDTPTLCPGITKNQKDEDTGIGSSREVDGINITKNRRSEKETPSRTDTSRPLNDPGQGGDLVQELSEKTTTEAARLLDMDKSKLMSRLNEIKCGIADPKNHRWKVVPKPPTLNYQRWAVQRWASSDIVETLQWQQAIERAISQITEHSQEANIWAVTTTIPPSVSATKTGVKKTEIKTERKSISLENPAQEHQEMRPDKSTFKITVDNVHSPTMTEVPLCIAVGEDQEGQKYTELPSSSVLKVTANHPHPGSFLPLTEKSKKANILKLYKHHKQTINSLFNLLMLISCRAS